MSLNYQQQQLQFYLFKEDHQVVQHVSTTIDNGANMKAAIEMTKYPAVFCFGL